MTSDLFLQLLVSGLLIGGIFALVSLGLSLIFGVMDIVNFAHGEFVMLGMYGVFFANAFWGVDPYLMLPVIGLLVGLLGYVVGRFLIRPVVDAPPAVHIFTTIGLSLILQNLALGVWSANFRTVDVEYRTATLSVGDVLISVPRLVAFAAAIVIGVAVYLFLRGTDPGRAIRAVSENRVAAALMGINVNRTFAWSFAFGTGLAGAAGAALTPLFAISPRSGIELGIIAFIAVVLGGLGSLPGAVVGSLILGLSETFSGFLIGTQLRQVVAFGIFILILAFRPTGIFGREVRRA